MHPFPAFLLGGDTEVMAGSGMEVMSEDRSAALPVLHRLPLGQYMREKTKTILFQVQYLC